MNSLRSGIVGNLIERLFSSRKCSSTSNPCSPANLKPVSVCRSTCRLVLLRNLILTYVVVISQLQGTHITVVAT